MTQRRDIRELDALLSTLRTTAPEAPTLCEGWQARHLVAHLYLRRHQPWRVQPEREGSVFAELAERARSPQEFSRLVERFAAPPPTLSPMALLDGPLGPVVNLMEYVIHHEDVRRGSGDRTPRRISPDLADAIFAQVKLTARLGLRAAGVGVVLVVPGGRRAVVRKGADAVAVTGAPIELALVAAGRRQAANVEVTGAPETVTAFESRT